MLEPHHHSQANLDDMIKSHLKVKNNFSKLGKQRTRVRKKFKAIVFEAFTMDEKIKSQREKKEPMKL